MLEEWMEKRIAELCPELHVDDFGFFITSTLMMRTKHISETSIFYKKFRSGAVPITISG